MVRRSSRSRSRGREVYQAGQVKAPKTPRAAKSPKSPPAVEEPTMQFVAGDGVMAKWPGSKLFYSAKVNLVRADDEEYDVEYENGTVFTVPSKDVYRPSNSSFRKAIPAARSKSKSRSVRGRKAKATPVKVQTEDAGDSTADESVAEEHAKKASSSSRGSRRSNSGIKLNTPTPKASTAVTDAFSEDDTDDLGMLSVSARASRSSQMAAGNESELELLATDQTELSEEAELAPGAASARASISSRISSLLFGTATPTRTSGVAASAAIVEEAIARAVVEESVARASATSSKKASDSSRVSSSEPIPDLEAVTEDEEDTTNIISASSKKASVSSRISAMLFGSSSPADSPSASSSDNFLANLEEETKDKEEIRTSNGSVRSSARSKKASVSSKISLSDSLANLEQVTEDEDEDIGSSNSTRASASSKKASVSSRISKRASLSSKEASPNGYDATEVDVTEAVNANEETAVDEKTSISSRISNVLFGGTPKASTSSKVCEVDDAPVVVVEDIAAAEVSSFPYISNRRSSRASTRASTMATNSSRRQSTGARASPGLDEFSEDEEKVETGVTEAPTAAEEEKVEAAGAGRWSLEWLWAVFFMVLCPAILVTLHSVCTGTTCGLALPSLSLDPRDYWDSEAVGMVLSFVLLLRALEFLCMGREVQGYRMNGFQSLVVVLLLVPILHYHGIQLHRVSAKYFQLMCSAILLSYAQAVFSLLLSHGADPATLSAKGNTANPLVNLFHGRQLNPSFVGANLKLQTFRFSMIGLALLNTLLVSEAFLTKEINPTVVIAATYQILYAMDAMYYEDCYFYSHDSLYSGYGWSLISSYLTFPFLPTLVTRYLVSASPALPWPALAAITAVNLLGYYIYRSSESQRCQLARDPAHPSLAHLLTLETIKGRKVIVSGWWGLVRHPNYLGELLVQWSWVLPAAPALGLTQLVPYYLPVITTLMLILRCLQINKRNGRKFGGAWTEYTGKVRANIVPFVF